MNKDILEFIKNFRSKHSDFQYLFTNGLCYHFAAILKNIFVGHIVYNDIDNHFAFYSSTYACIVDITGIISPNGFVKWDDYIERETLNSNRVFKECVMLKGQSYMNIKYSPMRIIKPINITFMTEEETMRYLISINNNKGHNGD